MVDWCVKRMRMIHSAAPTSLQSVLGASNASDNKRRLSLRSPLSLIRFGVLPGRWFSERESEIPET